MSDAKGTVLSNTGTNYHREKNLNHKKDSPPSAKNLSHASLPNEDTKVNNEGFKSMATPVHIVGVIIRYFLPRLNARPYRGRIVDFALEALSLPYFHNPPV
jgi:hypothetical protein